jgi:hypothetical protein
MNYEYNKGFADGYEKAYKEMISTVEEKIKRSNPISSIDEMYGRSSFMDNSYTSNSYIDATGYMP